MIAFSRKEKLGRLGNKLFQYAFVRTKARELGVEFYFPEWEGDWLFDLNDKDERSHYLAIMHHIYIDKGESYSFNDIKIEDKTDIQQGYFMNEKYFKADEVREWYRFKDAKIKHLKDFECDCSLHFRYGDLKDYPKVKVPDADYYAQALDIIKPKSVALFTDDFKKAVPIIKKLGIKVQHAFRQPYEDLYLISRCKNNICSTSTFSWWGAWLNENPEKKVICPKDRYNLWWTGYKMDIWPDSWIKI